ncbi:hypothetical protein [Isoptericola croceus]|uniref:hypothetical protein n=1 Tax=Isoptericola croceus TaxID=3031406 RepID=UPI0023F9589A|nr:hypothetical protein [Isoptericola croceus]
MGRDPVTEWHIAMHNGDSLSARVEMRARFQYSLVLVIGGLWLIVMGLLGARYADYGPWIWVVPGAAIAVLIFWGWIEQEFAWPGLLVDPASRGTPGRRKLRADEGDATERATGD